ncbi:MAG TPA: M28 family peptidase [Candidatus Angelobacter sp.]|nr:M28 family peptidase [Candidatus Angelobacter sp.]
MTKRKFEILILVLLTMALLGCDSKKSNSGTTETSSTQANQPSKNAQAASNVEPQGSAMHVDPTHAMQYVKEIVAFGPRWPGSKGQEKVAAYLRGKLKADHPEEDAFVADTPAGKLPMRNFIAKFQGTKDGIIVLGTHIDTLYPPQGNNFVGANDGGSSTGLLLAIADELRSKKVEGYSIWLAFLDGEEAIQQWSDTDSVYGSRHLAAKWQQDGTIGKIKAFLLADMIGDADLDIVRDLNSTPWLEDLVLEAAKRLGYQSHFFATQGPIGDDHQPFAKLGVPVADLIDFNYGYNNSYWHTPEDTIDKLSPRSLQIAGDVMVETIRLVNGRKQ